MALMLPTYEAPREGFLHFAKTSKTSVEQDPEILDCRPNLGSAKSHLHASVGCPRFSARTFRTPPPVRGVKI